MRRFLPLIILLGVITLFLFGTFKKNTRVIPTPLIGQEVPIMGLETRFYDDFESNILEDILKSNKIKIINFLGFMVSTLWSRASNSNGFEQEVRFYNYWCKL